MISDSLMKLKAGRQDQGFIAFQKERYDELIEATRVRCKAAEREEDADLVGHLQELDAKNLMGSDWNPFPLKDVTPGSDFVQDLLERYFRDLNSRKKRQEAGIQSVSVILRKGIRLEEIDEIIEAVQQRSIELAADAGQIAERLREEQR